MNRFSERLWMRDARQKWSWISEFIPPNAKVLDIGSGPGAVARVMRANHVDPHLMDVVDKSLGEDVQPEIVRDLPLPYADGAFDVALLLTVLHHVHEPAELLREAARVAHQVIVIEDTYNSRSQGWLTQRMDSLTNLEFRGHPHSNQTVTGWREVFHQLELREISSESRRVYVCFEQTTFVLASPEKDAPEIPSESAQTVFLRENLPV